jgi:radical SAM superfamily enzyme YgiQ (UPF0313 family)
MKILLIQPCSDAQRWKGQKSHFGWPPLGLGYVAAATPAIHGVHIVDEAVEAVDFNQSVDLVGIGIMTSNSIRGYEIADEFRKRNKPVVIGGIHASMLPEEAQQHADAVVVGEAESIWPQVLQDFSADQMQAPGPVPQTRLQDSINRDGDSRLSPRLQLLLDLQVFWTKIPKKKPSTRGPRDRVLARSPIHLRG